MMCPCTVRITGQITNTAPCCCCPPLSDRSASDDRQNGVGAKPKVSFHPAATVLHLRPICRHKRPPAAASGPIQRLRGSHEQQGIGPRIPSLREQPPPPNLQHDKWYSGRLRKVLLHAWWPCDKRSPAEGSGGCIGGWHARAGAGSRGTVPHRLRGGSLAPYVPYGALRSQRRRQLKPAFAPCHGGPTIAHRSWS